MYIELVYRVTHTVNLTHNLGFTLLFGLCFVLILKHNQFLNPKN